MSTTQTLETPPPCTKDVQGLLKDIANLLCPAHQHKITDPYILPGQQTRHSMIITCRQEGEVVWHVEMSANCLVKVISRCKVVSTSNIDQERTDIIFEPLATWEGPQCDDILWLLGTGHLEHGWWENNPSRWSDQNRGNRRNTGSSRGSGASGSHNYIANSEPTPDLPLSFPRSKDKYHQNEILPSAETIRGDKIVPTTTE
ncbi:hypothetical protein HOY80DRAFT_1137856 [Tuber brumale]|nr:hypothetical protein HOY80DRAFT_1137856 [Tuber brumale]